METIDIDQTSQLNGCLVLLYSLRSKFNPIYINRGLRLFQMDATLSTPFSVFQSVTSLIASLPFSIGSFLSAFGFISVWSGELTTIS